MRKKLFFALFILLSICSFPFLVTRRSTARPVMKFCIKCENMYYISINRQILVEDRVDIGLPPKRYPPGNKLVYYCRNCGYEDLTVNIMGGCIVERDYRQENQVIKHLVNQYTKYDVTLPRLYHLSCPNESCRSNADKKKNIDEEETKQRSHQPRTGAAAGGDDGEDHDDHGGEEDAKKSEVVYLRFDEKNMKYLYICYICDTVWKNK